MQRMQNQAQQKLNKADDNCEIKQKFFFMDSYFIG